MLNSWLLKTSTGYTGSWCETEIDECELWSPCSLNSSCIDLVNDYQCFCSVDFGGKNCSVYLEGCDHEPCLNGGYCEPFLVSEIPDIEHGHSCMCRPGTSGPDCSESTSFSFKYANRGKKDNVVVIPIEEDQIDFEIRFKFKTSFVEKEVPIAALYSNSTRFWQVVSKIQSSKT